MIALRDGLLLVNKIANIANGLGQMESWEKWHLLGTASLEEKQSFERWNLYQYVERASSITPTASLAGTEVSVDKIRSATASSDRYYPPSLHVPLINSPELDPNGANNLIPMEIALKIAEKIRASKRFAAYIVIPMWPEGNPTGAATQRILFWQVGTNYDFNA
ncbi:Phospholipase D beta 2 [Camellia lanceoleosa]|uniref:Phospholipase D beta 2 n=1 Tax=Camellia lanceoleosa TaxID=1840588 RepID=A0ACC0I8P3_9ERIC|nr:Phospholipase D beta 2 [Camellia lanceoleosa]